MKKRTLFILSLIILITTSVAAVFGGVVGGLAVVYLAPDLGLNLISTEESGNTNITTANVSIVNEESVIVDVAEQSSDSVVSIVISRQLTRLERNYLGVTEEGETQVGSGSGFIISEDGLIVTNSHVVDEEDSTYTVVFNDGSTIEAEIIDRDPLLDIAILKIDPEQTDFEIKPLPLGNSDSIKVGQSVIAIGNSLGRFSNTVSTGIISGLSRDIVASSEDGSNAERLTGVIQTDASINPGNSGGPLLDVEGNVIGVNVAVAEDAENIGFAIPIDLVMPAIESVEEYGEIRRPILGVRYQEITPSIAAEENYPVQYGAIIEEGTDGESGIVEGSAAEKAGLQEGDIIVGINGVMLDNTTTLQKEIQKLSVGDEITITYYRNGQERETTAVLQVLED